MLSFDINTYYLPFHETLLVFLSLEACPYLFQKDASLQIKLILLPPFAVRFWQEHIKCMHLVPFIDFFFQNDLTVEGNQVQSHILMHLRREVCSQHASVSFAGIFLLKCCQLSLCLILFKCNLAVMLTTSVSYSLCLTQGYQTLFHLNEV